MKFEVAVRWADLDAQGHVNNSVIVDYLQEARVQFLLSGANAHLLGNGVIVVSHSVDYLAPVRVAPVEVTVSVLEVGWSRFVLGYAVFQGDREVARASSELCLFDFAAGRPARFQPAEREAFLAQLRAAEPVPVRATASPAGRVGQYPLRVRWSDLDSYGHVNNTKFFDYFQEARIAFTTEIAPIMARAALGAEAPFVWLVVHQDVRYLTPIQHRLEPYLVRTWITRRGRTSLGLAAEILDPENGVIHARASTVLVCADPTLTPVPLPSEVAAL